MINSDIIINKNQFQNKLYRFRVGSNLCFSIYICISEWFCDSIHRPFNVCKIVLSIKLTWKKKHPANSFQKGNNFWLFGYGYKEILIIPTKLYECFILCQNKLKLF